MSKERKDPTSDRKPTKYQMQVAWEVISSMKEHTALVIYFDGTRFRFTRPAETHVAGPEYRPRTRTS